MNKNVKEFLGIAEEGFKAHPRQFQGSKLVYPVLSRRSKGISVGVNLSPGKACNFNCLYCQVDRSEGTGQVEKGFAVSLEVLERELRETLTSIVSGDIYHYEPFSKAKEDFRRLNDIALSGDGEPTGSPVFEQACEIIAKIKRGLSLNGVKIVLITNSTLLDREPVVRGLEVMDRNEGEIWAKLDAGTEEWYKFMNDSAVPFSKVLENIRITALSRPVVIQTLFSRVDGERVSQAEVAAYADRISDLLDGGARLAAIQLHTIARAPKDSRLTALSTEELKQISDEIYGRVDVPIELYE